MAAEVKLPRLGQGMESGTIVKWLKAEGEPVKKGEPLYELDTDKVTQEVEAEADGVLLAIAVREGEVPVGQTIAVIGTAGETYEVTVPAAPAPAAVASVAPAPGRGRRARSSRRERRSHQGIAARAPDRARAGDRAARADRHRAPTAGSSPRMSSERPRARPRPRRCASRAGRGRRARAAHVAPQDDRPPHDRGVAGARIPDLDVGGHEPRPGAARAARRAARRRGREADDLRRAHEGVRRRADAPPSRERPLRRRRDRAPSDRERRDRRRAAGRARRAGDPVAASARRSPSSPTPGPTS